MDWRRKIVIYTLIFVAAGTILAGLASPAQALVVVSPPPSEFQLIESVTGGVGQYTVINNSGENDYSAEYIYGFSVTNPLANQVQDWTTEKGWVASKTPLLGHPKTGFAYATIPGFFTFGRGQIEFHINPETIGPGEQASDFFFGTNLLASSVTLLLVNANGQFTTDTIASSVPEPATWAMMILGFMGIGFMAYRRKSRPILHIG